MTQQVNNEMMSREEFDTRHTRTGQHIARVEKVWEQIAEEQQVIIDGKGYLYMGYAAWSEYWDAEWKKASGWTWGTVEGWLKARRIKLGVEASGGTAGYVPTGADQWKELAGLEPEERTEFLEQYPEIKPTVSGGGHPFREAIKQFKGERQPAVRNVLSESDVKEIPSSELSEEEDWAFRTQKTLARLRRMRPHDVAEVVVKHKDGTNLDPEIDAAKQISAWYEVYAQVLEDCRRSASQLKAIQ